MTATTLPDAIAIESGHYEVQDKRSGAAKKRDAELGVRFGCHVDIMPGEEPDGCVIDEHERDSCVYGRRYREKWTCPHWAPASDPAVTARVDGWRAGYAAGLEAAAKYVERIGDYVSDARADTIRSLAIPEAPNG